ncbi:hypothetical protein [Clostridium akagii]|uniref:hypothetical protein n=1 Tax=Clostridium akagii TaxID=91623 RepID=UPI00047EA537|nr:hypothetical protein [Clostridium akagii]
MKYIGPFLKLNYLSKENIGNQLFHLAKENEKLLTFYSNFGIVSDSKRPELSIKSNYDINTFKAFSPLLCIYKKGDTKLINEGNKLHFLEDRFRQDIQISSNALMTLSILELAKYYKTVEGNHKAKHSLYKTYITVAENQLEFYLTYLRNAEGIFVDKKNISDSNEFKFENKSKGYLFSDQALIMAAFGSCSLLRRDKDGEQYKNFSFDIFNMIYGCRENIYDLSIDEIMKICLGLNLFYDFTMDPKVFSLLLDLYDCIEYNLEEDIGKEIITTKSMFLINSMLIYKHSNLIKYKDNALNTFKEINELYDSDIGIFKKESSKKEIDISSSDLILYLIATLLCFEGNNETETNRLVSSLFRHIVEASQIIGSWPDVPNLDSPERYLNFSLDSKDLLDEKNFKLDSMGTPESTLVLPLFLKEITYNKKKNSFSEPKSSFYSDQNMLFFFLFIYLFRPTFK